MYLFSLRTMPSLSLVLNLQVTLIPGRKQGPVRLTIVPPSMWPFSGAKVRGRLVPTEKAKKLDRFMSNNKIGRQEKTV
jgi:hypothetical protein